MNAFLKVNIAGLALLSSACQQKAPNGEAIAVERSDTPSSLPPLEQNLTVTEFVQSSQGVSESDIGPEFIAGIEDFLLKEKRAHYRNRMRDMGHEAEGGELSVASSVVDDEGRKLVITEIMTTNDPQGNPNASKIKIAWWIQGDQLKLVQCADTTGSLIAIRSGKCGDQISRTFGYRNWTLD